MTEIIGHCALEAMRFFLSATLWTANTTTSVVTVIHGVLISTGNLIMNAAAMTVEWSWPIFGCAAFRFREGEKR